VAGLAGEGGKLRTRRSWTGRTATACVRRRSQRRWQLKRGRF
jgi:hypothetical protein